MGNVREVTISVKMVMSVFDMIDSSHMFIQRFVQHPADLYRLYTEMSKVLPF